MNESWPASRTASIVSNVIVYHAVLMSRTIFAMTA